MNITTSLYTCKLTRLTRIEMEKDPETRDVLFTGVPRENCIKQFGAEYDQ